MQRGEKVRVLLVFDLFPEEGHRPVEMVEGKLVDAGNDVVPMPPVAGPVGAGGEEPMKDRQEDRPLHVEAELPVCEKTAENGVDLKLLPEPAENEGQALSSLPRRRDRSFRTARGAPSRRSARGNG